jgi:hypothetical protein
MVPPGQTVVADIDGMGQAEGTDPGEARFWLGPDPAALCTAPSLFWFGAGLGRAGTWLTARP